MGELALYLKSFNFTSIMLRLVLALVFGGLIGLERKQHHKAAGFRTYMLVCLGSALTMLLGQYQSFMMDSVWASASAEIGVRTDMTRFSAQVINGIGFLGAGTIIVTGNQEVKGLTTAAALWATACMGLVIGAGYYECVLVGFLLILLCLGALSPLETYCVQRSKNMNLYVEFETIDDVRDIIVFLKNNRVQIYDIDLDHGNKELNLYPSAVLALKQQKRGSHTQLIASLFSSAHIRRINEI